MNQRQIIDISTSTIFRVVLILLGLVFLYFIRDILAMLFVALIIVAAVDSPVRWLKRHKIPRVVGVLIVYLLLFVILGLIISLILPPLANEVGELAKNLPSYLESLGTRFQAVQEWWNKFKIGDTQELLSRIGGQLAKAASSVFATTVGIFGGLISALVILVISIYLAAQEKGIKKFFMSVTPPEHQAYILALAERIQTKIGGWVWGQLLLCLIIGVLTFLGLTLLGVPYALILALIAALLEVIPYLGPILAAVPAVIIAFLISPFLALLTLIL
ncbi:MAG TPA: AI-2E family transporter, partial [Candidatus Portnoybacteria bacterium]|nr:AI-2E family transporter [Candidatus Portnoybacteria bacterium]